MGDYKKFNEDLNSGKYIGTYGGAYSLYRCLAEVRKNKDILKHNELKTSEYLNEGLLKHLNNELTRKKWNDISSINPLGLTSKIPTMACTTATLNIPELDGKLFNDGVIVDADGGINVTKIAIQYSWNLKKLANKINMSEDKLRQAIYKSTNNENILNKDCNIFLPNIGGMTVYILGDINKVSDPMAEISVRVHDECNGSDVFGTDICTCRPYLTYAMKCCVECAQRNGVGIIVYFRKEGRALDEVVKYRVYNARKRQVGGDCSEKYFEHTENIAGERDVRVQELMPEVLLWLGIERIDWLLSMSREKYDALVSSGIKIMQRIPLPDKHVPRNAHVEITAKISDGYHSVKWDNKELIKKLQKIETTRAKATSIYEMGLKDELHHFRINLDKMNDAVEYTINIIETNYPDLDIPQHSRIRHFEKFDPKFIQTFNNSFKCSDKEKIRRMIDLTIISVLTDAGAGNWRYIKDNKIYTRSEGLAYASYDMFMSGMFSSDEACPFRVNSKGIEKLSFERFQSGFQITEDNQLFGLENRFKIIKRLGGCLNSFPTYFGYEIKRPGNLLDYIENRFGKEITITQFWKILCNTFAYIWSTNQKTIGCRGDVFVYSPLKKMQEVGSDLIPFHKLLHWIMYSLIEPLELYGIKFLNKEIMLPLPEYRNGGLLIDIGLIGLKDPTYYEKVHNVGSELIVEWRALTLILIEKIKEGINEYYKNDGVKLTMSQVLQGGTWAAGRVIAQERRKTSNPPLTIRSDGTVF
jgi:GTP cyclohydrolase II